MAGEINLKRGSKILMAYDVPLGKDPSFNMIVSFNRNLDESVFLVSVPMGKDGKPIELDENAKILMRFGTGPVQSLIAAYADDLVVEGIHSYWKMRRVTEHRQFIKRADERVRAQMHVEYTQDTWAQKADGTTVHERGYSLDISNSGCAMYMNSRFEVGETIEIFLPGVGTGIGSDPLNYVVCAVCWNREAPKGSPYHHVVGLQYRFSDGPDKERMKLYVQHVKEVFKL